MRRYRSAAIPRTVATERKTMPNTRSPTGWYYCSYLLRLTLAGSPSAQDPEARFLSYENTVLIRADSSLEAYDKTLRIARENETSYTNEHQQDVQFSCTMPCATLPWAKQYANQFHSAQAHQLLQLRNMINTEMQANAAYRQGRLDQEAREAAADKRATGYGAFRIR